jgi:hypothetical protein
MKSEAACSMWVYICWLHVRLQNFSFMLKLLSNMWQLIFYVVVGIDQFYLLLLVCRRLILVWIPNYCYSLLMQV